MKRNVRLSTKVVGELLLLVSLSGCAASLGLEERIDKFRRELKHPVPRTVQIEVVWEVANTDEDGAEQTADPADTQALFGDGSLWEEDIRQLVDERLEEKLQARGDTGGGDGGGGGKKVPIDELAEDLNLTPQVQAQVADVANQTKKEIFDLLRTPRANSSTIADDLLDAMASGNQDQIGAVFIKIFTERIPGTEQTYAAGAGVIQYRARQNLKGIMGETTYQKFSGMNVKTENIQTSYDPWADYMQQRNP